MTAKFPVLRQYRLAWPIHEIMKQFLGTQKSNFKKDDEAESNETRKPNRKLIEEYLNSLPSQKTRIQAYASDGDQEEDNSEEGDVWEDDDDQEEEEEVSVQNSQAKKNMLQKSRYLQDKCSALNKPKPIPSGFNIPKKTLHAFIEKKDTDKENVMTTMRASKDIGEKKSKVRRGNESKVRIWPFLPYHIYTILFLVEMEGYQWHWWQTSGKKLEGIS